MFQHRSEIVGVLPQPPDRRECPDLKGARTRSPSRCGLVFVYEPAQDVAADQASSAVLRARPRCMRRSGRVAESRRPCRPKFRRGRTDRFHVALRSVANGRVRAES